MTEEFVNINLCGKPYELSKNCLESQKEFAKTFLGNFANLPHEKRLELCDDYFASSRSYFFWKTPKIFDTILSYYGNVGRKIHCPVQVCPQQFLEELEFWDIDLNVLSLCCRKKINFQAALKKRQMTENGKIQKLKSESKSLELDETTDQVGCKRLSLQIPTFVEQKKSPGQPEKVKTLLMEKSSVITDDFSTIFYGNYRRTIWIFLEDPTSSKAAKIFSLISVLFVLTSVITLILGSLSFFQKSDGEPVHTLEQIEYACVAWFTFEYFARFLVSAKKWVYVKSPINVIDLVSVLPFYIELALLAGQVNTEKFKNLKGALLVMRMLRLLRVARLFKLARYSGGMKSFGETISSSVTEIGMLLMFLSTTVILFSTAVYFLEKGAEDTPFTSIPAAFWWCVVTMTTVGYGDMIPVTIGSKLVASLTTITGVIVLAFPITMIVENFSKTYEKSHPNQALVGYPNEDVDREQKFPVRSVSLV